MLLRIIIFSVFLFFASSGFTAVNAEYVNKEKNASAQSGDNYTYIYKWIDGVRWMFVYDQDGVMINSYPDPEY